MGNCRDDFSALDAANQKKSRHRILFNNLSHIGISVANATAATVAIIWLSWGTWKKKKITHDLRLKSQTIKETIICGGIPDK